MDGAGMARKSVQFECHSENGHLLSWDGLPLGLIQKGAIGVFKHVK